MGFFDSIDSEKAGTHLLNCVSPVPESLRVRAIATVKKAAKRAGADPDTILDMLGLLESPTE